MDFSSVAETTGKSIVRVEGRRTRPSSGVVWAPNRVLTVAHALDREGDIVVGLEGVEHKAKLKGRDPSTDLALLELDAALTPATFDDGEGVKVGQEALLLARPGETVRASAGIISVRGNKPWRTPRGGEIDRYLESDAAHQPGYSGGALVSSTGKVLGLVTTGLLRGTSLAVPVPTLRRVVAQLETHGKVRKSYLGLSMQPVRLPDDVQKLTGEEIGLLVVGLDKGGPAEKAGIAYGDTILHLGDATVKTLEDLYAYIRADHVGQTVPAKVYRNGKVDTVQVTLEARPVNPLELFSDELEKLVQRAAPGVIALEDRRGNGTGMLFTPDGYALTNAHVTKRHRSMRVRFHDGQETDADIIGRDETTDLAVLRTGRPGEPLPLAEASQVKVGQVVIALGHPYGFERSVTMGVVSAIERRLPGRDGAVLDGLIQTDAAINPGNSGGPLLSVRGQVVGINTAMLPFAQGIGFAVPASTAAWVAGLLMRHGEVRRRYLGIAARNESLAPELAVQVGQPRGIRVMEVGRGSPADSAGLARQDLLLQVNGTPVATIEDLQRTMAIDSAPEFALTVWKAGARSQRTVRPTLRTAA